MTFPGGDTIVSSRSVTLLVVDDDRAVRDACEEFVGGLGISTVSASSAREALTLMERSPVDVVLTDLRMPGMDGLEFLKVVRSTNPDAFVIVMTGFGSVETAVEAMKHGAYDFLCKPFKLQELRQKLEKIQDQLALNCEARRLREELDKAGGFPMVIGRSSEMQKAYRVTMRAVSSSNPVLLLGEPGTGKELLARSIHLAMHNDLPFIPVDCCSLMPELLDAELFGHSKGAFPGAATNKAGLLASAECGTVYLDEVAELSLDAQSKLARALQEKAIRPYGSTKKVPFRARVIAASSRDLPTTVAAGKFRQDLYYRLSGLVVHLPPLRERKEDIPLLVEHFLRKLSNEHGTKKTIAPEARKAIATMDWPGNVAQLESVLEHAYALASGGSITLSDLPPANVASPSSQVNAPARSLPLAEIERLSVLRAIEDSGGDKQKAARLLGISRTTLYRKLNEYKLSQ